MRPARPCKTPGCPELRPCSAHPEREPWAESRRRFELPPDWKQRRLRVMVRDRWQCQIRGEHCRGKATDCDHIGRNDDHSLDNLRAACRPCHDQHTAEQRAAARRPPA
jgi:5-methylcytosine-specific restriction protein A